MDADARRILELLGPAVERAEQVGAQQEALLQRQEASAQELASQIADMTQAAEDQRARLLQARSEFDALREAEVARGKHEADSIVAAARAEEEAARAKIAQLQREQAQIEAAHAAKLAQADLERAEAEAAHLERLREREAEQAASLA